MRVRAVIHETSQEIRGQNKVQWIQRQAKTDTSAWDAKQRMTSTLARRNSQDLDEETWPVSGRVKGSISRVSSSPQRLEVGRSRSSPFAGIIQIKFNGSFSERIMPKAIIEHPSADTHNLREPISSHP